MKGFPKRYANIHYLVRKIKLKCNLHQFCTFIVLFTSVLHRISKYFFINCEGGRQHVINVVSNENEQYMYIFCLVPFWIMIYFAPLFLMSSKSPLTGNGLFQFLACQRRNENWWLDVVSEFAYHVGMSYTRWANSKIRDCFWPYPRNEHKKILSKFESIII